MKKPPVNKVKVYCTSVLKAFRRNHVFNAGKGAEISPPQVTKKGLTGLPFLTRTRLMADTTNIKSPVSSFRDPCFDLFYHFQPPEPVVPAAAAAAPKYSSEYLTQLLPKAWSHSPLTTLKLICHLLRKRIFDTQDFYTAAHWLYQNHPATLASNVAAFASIANLTNLLEVLYRSLQGQDIMHKRNSTNSSTSISPRYKEMYQGIGGRTSSRKRREKIITMAEKATEKYRIDPNYRMLHDAVSDLYAQCFKHDIENLNNCLMMRTNALENTNAAEWVPHFDSLYDRQTLLWENIARKYFSLQDSDDAADCDSAALLERLKKEVLVPLRKVFDENSLLCKHGYNRWGFDCGNFKKDSDYVEAYLEEVAKAIGGGNSKIGNAGALLPNQIIQYVVDRNKYNQINGGEENDDGGGLVAAAELQWKTMVEEVYLEQGKFKNCLAVCDVRAAVFGEVAAASLALLMSELSQEPWKGKVITFNQNPEMVSIQGDDLQSKYEFMSKMDFEDHDLKVDLLKVFDLILEAAVNENLKPEQMINTVFVFTFGLVNEWGENDFEEVRCKFKEKGYGDVVPNVVFWKLGPGLTGVEAPRRLPGLTVLRGFTDNNLIRSFLDNDGDIGLDHVMEAVISGESYQHLVVVD